MSGTYSGPVVEVAISLDRGTQLRDGDTLCWDEAHHTTVVAHVNLASPHRMPPAPSRQLAK